MCVWKRPKINVAGDGQFKKLKHSSRKMCRLYRQALLPLPNVSEMGHCHLSIEQKWEINVIPMQKNFFNCLLL